MELPKLDFTLKKMGDLLFWEGPLMSHFVNDQKEDFIFKWASKDGLHNRWMVYRSTPALLLDYFEGRINSADLILKNPDGSVYFIDMDNDMNWRKIYLVNIQDIPKKYMPLKDSFYEIETYEPYAEKLRTNIELHFSRPIKSYKAPEATIEIVAEPPPNIYEKKKKGKG